MKNNRKLKSTVTETVKVIAFVLAFLILLEGLSLSVFSGRNAAKFNANLRDAYSFVEEPDYTIQIAGVGNSNLYSGFVPFSMWDECGYTSTICASPKQSISQSQNLLKKVYKTQKPKLIIIETDMFYDHLVQNDNQSSKRKISLNAVITRAKPDRFEDTIPQIFSIFSFHNRWKKQRAESVKNSFLHTHGYRYNNTVCEIDTADYMTETADIEPISDRNLNEINKLIDLCTKEGSQVMLITVPSASAWNYERHNAVENYAKQKKINYIDMNLLYADAGINLKNAFRDNGRHLNYDSADKLTRYISEYIRQNYDLQCLKDNPEYSKWNEETDNFNKKRNAVLV